MVKKFFRKIFNKKEESEITDEKDLSSETTSHFDKESENIISNEDEDTSPNKIHDEDQSLNEIHDEEQSFNEIHDEERSLSEIHSDLNEDIDEKLVHEEFIEEEIDHTLPPIENDLPDLPAEVLKALEQNDSDQEIEEDNEDDEDFDFTEIKSTNLTNNDEDIDSDTYADQEDEEEFDFTEIKSNATKEKLEEVDQRNKAKENEIDEENENEIPFDFNELQVDLPGSNKSKFKSFIFKLKNTLEKIKNIKKGNQDQKAIIDEVKKSQAHYLFIGLLVLFSSYYSGKLIALMLMGKESTIDKVKVVKNLKKKNSVSIRELEKLNPLNALATSKKPDKNKKEVVKKVVIDEKKVCQKSQKKSSIGITVDTIIVLQDRVKSIASVQIRNKDQYIREGDKIDGMAIIGAIDSGRIIFRNLKNGNCEFIESKNNKSKNKTNKTFSKVKIHSAEKAKNLLPADPNIQVDGNKFKINSSIRNELMDNITDVLSQARAIQIKNSDGSLSFKIVEIVPGSIYSKLNIQENDVITKINGQKIENLNEIMSLFGRIKDLKNLDLGIERDGIENDFQYSFE